MTRRVDAHVHVWDRSRNPQPWIEPDTMAVIDRDFGADDVTRMLSATHRDAAVLVQSTNSLRETEDLFALAADAPVAAVVGWVDLTGDVPTQLAGLHGPLLRGIRHLAHLEADPRWLLRPDVGTGLDVLAQQDLVFDLVVRAHQLPTAAELAQAHPDLRLVLDHLGNPEPGELDRWQADLAALAAQPNVTAKVSGLAAHPEPEAVLDVALEAFGPSRLMYGSDWPLAELAEGGAQAWSDVVHHFADGLAADERGALLGGTAARAYRIAA